jgi:hypothetical protein
MYLRNVGTTRVWLRRSGAGDAEVVGFGVGEDGPGVAVLVVVGAAGGAEGEQAGDLLLAVVGDEVDVDPVLDRAGFGKAALTKNHDAKVRCALQPG